MIPLPLGDITGIEAEVTGPAGGLPVAAEPAAAVADEPVGLGAAEAEPTDVELGGLDAKEPEPADGEPANAELAEAELAMDGPGPAVEAEL